MVGDGQVLVAPLHGYLCQLGDRIHAVAVIAVHMQVAFDVGGLDQRGKLPTLRRLDLAPVLPQFRRYVRQAQQPEKFLFGARAKQFLWLHDPVFADLPAVLTRPLAQGDVVLLGTGEVVQGSSKKGWRHDVEVDLNPPDCQDGRLHLANRQHLSHPGRLYKLSDDRRDIIRGHHQVQISHRLLAPAVASRSLHGGGLYPTRQIVLDLLDHAGSKVQQPALLALLHSAKAVQDLLFRFLADAGQLTQALRPRRRL